MKLQALLLLAVVAVLGGSQAALLTKRVVSPVPPLLKAPDANLVMPADDLSDDDDDDDNAVAALIDDDSNEEDSDDFGLLPDLDLDELRDEDLEPYADAKDLELEGELDLIAAARLIRARGERTRAKRSIPLAARALWTAGRALFRSSTRGALSRSGSRLTRQYASRGNYNDAVRHFRNFRPENVRNIQTDRLQGMTGTVGRHRITVRSSSSSGRPTLEIRSPSGRQGTDTYVRKFRFDN